MNLETLQITQIEIDDPKYGFQVIIQEDHINKAAKFELIYEGILKKAGAKLDKMFDDPLTVGFGTYFALNAIQAYQKSKKYSTTLYAKSLNDKKMYEKIVADLMKTGHYKITKNKYADGGWLWELQQS